MALKALVERRHDLIKMQTAEKNRLQAPTADKVIVETCKKMLTILQSQIKMLEKNIDNLIKADESGSKSSYRFIKGGGPQIRRIMFMAALTASKHDPRLKEHYQKLIKNGKKSIVAITAIARKIIVIANAKIRDNVYYSN